MRVIDNELHDENWGNLLVELQLIDEWEAAQWLLVEEERRCVSPSPSLGCACLFVSTPQGEEYWYDIQDKLEEARKAKLWETTIEGQLHLNRTSHCEDEE
jgi:hypothetical protein